MVVAVVNAAMPSMNVPSVTRMIAVTSSLVGAVVNVPTSLAEVQVLCTANVILV